MTSYNYQNHGNAYNPHGSNYSGNYTGYHTPLTNYKKPTRHTHYELEGKGKLIITEELQKQIDFLHMQVGSIEWCGVLFYKVLEGTLGDPESLVIQAEQVYPMNIGSETYTAAEMEGIDVVDMYEKCNPNYTLKQGLIHTHHRMAAFFSGTDDQELHDNTPNHNFYLSLIVNFSGQYVAKVAYMAKMETKAKVQFKYKEVDDTEHEYDGDDKHKTEDVMMTLDLEVIRPSIPEVVPTYFHKRIETLKTPKQRSVYTHTPSAPVGGFAAKQQNLSFGDGDDWESDYFSNKYQGSEVVNGQNSRIGNSQVVSEAQKKANSLSQQQEEKGQGKKKLVNSKGQYISATPEEIESVVLEWLNTGLQMSPDINYTNNEFTSIKQALEFFEENFSENPTNTFFLDGMQKETVIVFKEYFPKLIQNRGTKILHEYTDQYSIAIDLMNILETYHEFADNKSTSKTDR